LTAKELETAKAMMLKLKHSPLSASDKERIQKALKKL
jgi:hypothetical protein